MCLTQHLHKLFQCVTSRKPGEIISESDDEEEEESNPDDEEVTLICFCYILQGR